MAVNVLQRGHEPREQDIRDAVDPKPEPAPDGEWVTDGGMHVARYAIPLDRVPVDFFGDPDGSWTYDTLVQAAGFIPGAGVAIGALKEPFCGHPEGAAVVTLDAAARPYIAIVECPIAYTLAQADTEREISAA